MGDTSAKPSSFMRHILHPNTSDVKGPLYRTYNAFSPSRIGSRSALRWPSRFLPPPPSSLAIAKPVPLRYADLHGSYAIPHGPLLCLWHDPCMTLPLP